MDIIEWGPIIIAAIAIFIYLLGSTLGVEFGMGPDQLLLTILASISLYIIAFSLKTRISFDEINMTLNKKSKETAIIKVITDQKEFYSILQEKINGSKKRVFLMHLDPHAPDYYQDDVRVSYFKFTEEFARRNSVDMRRIMSLPTPDKIEWAEKLIDRIGVSTPRLSFGYINIGDLEKSFPTTVVSCQLIDDDKIFLLNPSLNVVPGGTFGECLYIENSEIVKIYEKYYNKLWDTVEKGDDNYCLLKNGIYCYKNNLIKIKENMNKESSQSSLVSVPIIPVISDM